jgi:serine/threonine-protein kinase
VKGEDLEALADRIAEGEAVDWDHLIAQSPLADRTLLAQLRTLSEIVHVHRTAEEPSLGVVEPSQPPRPSIGQWGHMQLLERLGSGAYGEVYRAWDPRLEREVALKLLWTHAGRQTRRVIHEARRLAKIRHPNVPIVHGARVVDDRVGLWSELIEGRTLDELVTWLGPLSADEAAHICSAVCSALTAAHSAGLLHLDIKAQNVIRARGGRIVLLDFGAGGELWNVAARPAVAGTPAYLAPEIFIGEAPSVRSDIYSLGVLTYFLVTGTFPMPGNSLEEIREAHRRSDRIQLRDLRPDLTSGFSHIVERALSPRPDARFATAAEFQRALERYSSIRDASAAERSRESRRRSGLLGWFRRL